MQDGDAPGVDNLPVDAHVILVTAEDLAHEGHVEGAPVVLVHLALQFGTVGGEVARMKTAFAAGDVERIAAKKVLLPGGDVAEAWHDGAAAHEGCGGLTVAGFGDGAGDAGTIDLVHEIAAHQAA